ncbi:MAG: SMP-30/gluconolactonase/LRE family protein [Isosphaeraceae bacterium]
MITVLRDAGLSSLVDADSRLERVAGGFVFTEGPLWLSDGALLFQDVKAERTHRLAADGTLTTLREQTRGANGQTFLPDGSVIFCEQNGRRVSKMNPDGTGVATVIEEFEGKRLNSPNDIVVRSDGTVFFTDPPYGAPPDRPLDFQAVFALDRAGTLHKVADGFEKPNGLAFSPDERTLYLNDTARYQVLALEIDKEGFTAVGPARVLATPDPSEKGGPDGMKVDCSGRIYVAVAEGVWVYSPDGTLLGILSTPKRPANLAWCGAQADTLALTIVDEVYRVRLNTRGCAPPFQPR